MTPRLCRLRASGNPDCVGWQATMMFRNTWVNSCSLLPVVRCVCISAFSVLREAQPSVLGPFLSSFLFWFGIVQLVEHFTRGLHPKDAISATAMNPPSLECTTAQHKHTRVGCALLGFLLILNNPGLGRDPPDNSKPSNAPGYCHSSVIFDSLLSLLYYKNSILPVLFLSKSKVFNGFPWVSPRTGRMGHYHQGNVSGGTATFPIASPPTERWG